MAIPYRPERPSPRRSQGVIGKSTVSSSGRPLARMLRRLLTLILLGLAVYLLLPQITTLEHSLQVIRQMVLWAVALAVMMQVISYMGSGYLLKALAAVVGQRLSVVRGMAIFTAASSLSLAGGGPVGFTAAMYRWMRLSGVSREGAALAGPLPTLLYDAALLLMAVFGLVHLLITHDLSTFQAVSFGLILLALISLLVAAAWAMRHRTSVTALALRLARRWAKLRRRPLDATAVEAAAGRWFSAWDTLRAGGWRGLALGALLNTVFDMLTLYFLFIAAHHSVSPGVLLAGYGLPLLLGKLSFLPGGLGIVEATMAALYGSLGVPHAVTVVVILAYRFLSFWLPLLIGFPLIPYLQRVGRPGSVNTAGGA